MDERGVAKISISLPKKILKDLDEFRKKNHRPKRSTLILEAIEKLLGQGQ